MTEHNVPASFVDEARQSFESNDRPHLILMTMEVNGMPWEASAKAALRDYLSRLPSEPRVHRAVLFTGHRIDSDTRPVPRFPPDREPEARQAIQNMLEQQLQKGAVCGLAGGANGGDIIFLEACRDLGVPFHILLALPENQFIPKSVEASTGNWVRRFSALTQLSTPRILAQSKAMPDWLATKKNYNFWARNNLWLISSALALKPEHFVIAALWDGAAGDGAGGTEDMVRSAQQHGAELIHLDTRELFSATRSAAP